MHFSNRWILNNQCYTCHADYWFLGPITTKLGSLRHVAIYYSGIGMPKTINLRKPFPNSTCLECHGLAANCQKQSRARSRNETAPGQST